jgi:hypothetical protein
MTKSQIADTRPLGSEKSWARTNGTYISGRAYIDGADETAAEMEAKWGADRLRLLVSPELREKFDRQRYKMNQAVWHGELEDVRRESGRMVNAWLALDHAATSNGRQPVDPSVWEIALGDGTVAAIVPDHACAALVTAEGRQVAVYTLDEIARILTVYPEVSKAKVVFPGATVTAVRRSVNDPLSEVWDTKEELDDPIPNMS